MHVRRIPISYLYCLHTLKNTMVFGWYESLSWQETKKHFFNLLVLDLVMDRAPTNIESKLRSIDTRQYLLIIVNGNRCMGAVPLLQRLPLQWLYDARLRWPTSVFMVCSNCVVQLGFPGSRFFSSFSMSSIYHSSSSSRKYDHESWIIYTSLAFIFKNHQFPFENPLGFPTIFVPNAPFFGSHQLPTSPAWQPENIASEGIGFGWIKVYHLGFLGSSLLSMLGYCGILAIFGVHKR